MVDAERLHRILREITTRLTTLRRYAVEVQDAGSRTRLLADEVRMAHVKWTFQGALEAAIDAAHHVLATEGGPVPANNADSFRALARGGWIDGPLATRLAGAAGFRNVLVHRYAEVDDGLVLDNLDALDDLDDLIDQLSRLLR
jgi:uncharacterized protein YutE (UPF0331/DUF86 family)